jgi:hypothetical protein
MRTAFMKRIRIVAAALAAALLAACGGGGGGGGGTTGTGTLSFALTDAACGGYDQVNVTVTKVRVHQSSSAEGNDSGWSEVDVNPPKKFNLLDLQNGVLEDLGQTVLPAGHYTQIRLVLASNGTGTPANSVVPTGGSEEPLETPSAVQTGIKLIHQFTVETDQLVDLVLDFDACRSVVRRGNGTYLLKPVVRVTPKTVTGIIGTVDPAISGAIVSAQKDGVVVRETVPNPVGEFALAPLDPDGGPYDIVVTAPDHASAVVAAVTVTDGATTRISTTAEPITLPTSEMREVSGTVTDSAGTPAPLDAAMRALQTVDSVNAEIGQTNTDPTSGDYAFSLPVAAPIFATYATPLPLTFTESTGSAGMYTIEASAEGFATQTKDVDITTDPATGVDFTLAAP